MTDDDLIFRPLDRFIEQRKHMQVVVDLSVPPEPPVRRDLPDLPAILVRRSSRSYRSNWSTGSSRAFRGYRFHAVDDDFLFAGFSRGRMSAQHCALF